MQRRHQGSAERQPAVSRQPDSGVALRSGDPEHPRPVAARDGRWSVPSSQADLPGSESVRREARSAGGTEQPVQQPLLHRSLRQRAGLHAGQPRHLSQRNVEVARPDAEQRGVVEADVHERAAERHPLRLHPHSCPPLATGRGRADSAVARHPAAALSDAAVAARAAVRHRRQP